MSVALDADLDAFATLFFPTIGLFFISFTAQAVAIEKYKRTKHCLTASHTENRAAYCAPGLRRQTELALLKGAS